MADLVRADQLMRRYGDDVSGTVALRDASFDIGQGEYLAIVGRSGSGKSTLLNILGLLDRPTDGRLHLLGERADRLGDRGRAALRNRHIGFVFQFHHLLAEFSVRENLLMPVRIGGGRDDRGSRRRLDELADLLGIGDLLDKPADQLSGGQKQRVAIARALIQRPQLLLADEPVASVDEETATVILELLARFRDEHGMTVLISLHQRQYVERYCNRAIELRNGVLMQDTSFASGTGGASAAMGTVA